MRLGIAFSLCFVTLCATAEAQTTTKADGVPDGYIALLRSDVQSQKVDIIRQNITLSEQQAKTFWPLQRSYENELSALGDERVNVIKDYAKNWDNLSDSTAKDLGTRLLDYQKKRVDLRKKCFDRMSKEVTPTVAAKFFQVEIQLENLIDIEIASSLPLIK
jgi:hypothetical protein